jgi:hypothetical protein
MKKPYHKYIFVLIETHIMMPKRTSIRAMVLYVKYLFFSHSTLVLLAINLPIMIDEEERVAMIA